MKGSPSNRQRNSALSPLFTQTSLISVNNSGPSLTSKLQVCSELELSTCTSTLLQDSEEEEQLCEISSVNWTERAVSPTDTELKVPVRLILDSELDALAKAASSGRQGRVEEI